MKYLFIILLMCSSAHAKLSVDEASITGWGKDVTVTVVIKGTKYILKTNQDEVDKYLADENEDTVINKFIEEVRYAANRK